MILQNFIVFEGIDGAGTSTQIERLKARPDAKKFFFTTEPTDGPTGKFLRSMLKGDVHLDPRTAAYLFAADRAEHLWGKSAPNGGIVSKCEQGKIVVSDRYLFSSLTYQSVTCGDSLPRMLNEPFPLPQLLFFFEVDPEISLKRVLGRGETEIYEKIDFQKATAQRYRAVINEYDGSPKGEGMKIVRIDASQSIDTVAEIIAREIEFLTERTERTETKNTSP
ncbi:MAG: dTMP kinase [Treponema sp.]|nr:dTMP kinase [Treponema sp.]